MSKTIPASASDARIKSTLIDITNCIGCRACQVACKEWNEREGEPTGLLGGDLGYQNPAVLSAKTLTLISFHEMEEEKSPGGLRTDFVMRRCLHCIEPACVAACPTTALERRLDGPTVFDSSQCIGCRYCVWACPWGVPTADWDTLTPEIHKCTHCADRYDQPAPVSRNEQALSDAETKSFVDNITNPACVKACPADALKFGNRDEMLAEAHRRMGNRPGRYVDHIYGEKEGGGTSVLYISAVPFEKLGFPTIGPEPVPIHASKALRMVAPAVIVLGALLGGAAKFFKRRARLAATPAAQASSAPAAAPAAPAHHDEFEKLDAKLWSPFNLLLVALMVFGLISFASRFVRGLGGSTNLSDTWPWGLWIIFDLVWIATAAGAFATAALIYVFQRKDLYGLGRAAVFIGLLSYSFVTVTLVADLGRPWNAYQLALQAPEHSAMFEVSWCVGLYVTVLMFEFVPVVFEQRGWNRAMGLWRRWSGAYVAAIATLFVYLLSRSWAYAGAAAAVFAVLAWIFRARTNKFEPITAGTLSTMHQSSLGSLFLLMPGKVAPQWWSPLMPITFFLSSIAAGTATLILVGVWLSKGWRRPLRRTRVASMGQITFWSLLVYVLFRLGDLAARGQLVSAFTVRFGSLFAVEIGSAVLALVLLSRDAWRMRPALTFTGGALAAGGIVLHRVNVVYLGMQPTGPMPWTAPSTYAPAWAEWGLSIGLIAATIFLFGVGARRLPLLPKPDTGETGSEAAVGS
jgi:formate dehydrogenase iron-sulfur subunit